MPNSLWINNQILSQKISLFLFECLIIVKMILVCHRTLHNWISSSNLGLAGLVRTKASCCVIKGLLILPFPVSAVSQVRSLSAERLRSDRALRIYGLLRLQEEHRWDGEALVGLFVFEKGALRLLPSTPFVLSLSLILVHALDGWTSVRW